MLYDAFYLVYKGILIKNVICATFIWRFWNILNYFIIALVHLLSLTLTMEKSK